MSPEERRLVQIMKILEEIRDRLPVQQIVLPPASPSPKIQPHPFEGWKITCGTPDTTDGDSA